MDGISRCMHWISRGIESTGFPKHGFRETGQRIWKKVEEIGALTGETTAEDARFLVPKRLEQLDFDLALFSLHEISTRAAPKNMSARHTTFNFLRNRATLPLPINVRPALYHSSPDFMNALP